MAIKRFEDVIAWRKAQGLAVEIYLEFGALKDFGFKDQICQAVISVSNNIAEGFDRGSNVDFIRFLRIATSSCSEVKSMLYLAEKLKYIDEYKKNYLLTNADEISKIIKGLIKSLQKK